MDLSERKKKILSAVIETNLKNKNAEAVSSKKLQEDYLPKISSATIRNELNALEEMGYLTHLHTSSGRVPTKEGYTKYINELMQEKKLTQKEKQIIKQDFTNKLVSIHDIIERSAKTISKATNYASIVYSGSSRNATIKDIHLYPVSKTTQLVVVVTTDNIINELANLGTNDEEELKAAGEILKDIFKDKPLSLIKNRNFREKVVTKELKKYQVVFDRVLDILEEKNGKISENLSIAGREKLMDYPEFNDINKFKNAVSAFDDKEKILPLIEKNDDMEISINIGGEDGIEDCSVVTLTCNVSDGTKITAGVVGPIRMDYPKAVSVLKEVAESIENTLNGEDEL